MCTLVPVDPAYPSPLSLPQSFTWALTFPQLPQAVRSTFLLDIRGAYAHLTSRSTSHSALHLLLYLSPPEVSSLCLQSPALGARVSVLSPIDPVPALVKLPSQSLLFGSAAS